MPPPDLLLATPADLLMTSMVTSRCSLNACFSRGSMPDSIGRPHALMCLSCCFVAGPGDLPDPGVTRVYLPPDVRQHITHPSRGGSVWDVHRRGLEVSREGKFFLIEAVEIVCNSQILYLSFVWFLFPQAF